MTENTLYVLNQARQCHNTPDDLKNSQTEIILYTKHFRKELNATATSARKKALRTKQPQQPWPFYIKNY